MMFETSTAALGIAQPLIGDELSFNCKGKVVAVKEEEQWETAWGEGTPPPLIVVSLQMTRFEVTRA